MDRTQNIIILVVFVVFAATLFMLLHFTPGLVDTRIEDGVGPGAGSDCQNVVGIDLGTSYSSVGVYINNSVTIIPNEHGQLKTPSYVAFTRNGEPVIGDEAKIYLTTAPRCVVFHVLRFLGRKSTDQFVKHQRKFYPFNISSTDRNDVAFNVKVKDKTKVFAAEEILALILNKMKEIAESYLKRPVDCAMVSVPAVFLQAQRHAVKDAGLIAGVKVMRVLNTPSIAATAYITASNTALSTWGETNVLVYYLGAGHCEVSLMTITSTVVQVSATNGTRNTGSEKFISAIMRYYFNQHSLRGHDIRDDDIRDDDIIAQRLRREVERAMLEFYMGGKNSTTVIVQSSEGKTVVEDLLTRKRFEELCEDIILGTMTHMNRMLAEAKQLNLKVKDIVLLGGGSRVAGVKRVIMSVFPKMNVFYGESEAGVAKIYGLTLHSALIQKKVKSPILLDVSSRAFGMFLKNQNDTVIPQFSPLPFQKTARYVTAVDKQENVDTTFYEGDVPRPGVNMLMYKLEMKGLRKRLAGESSIEIQYELSVDGLLQIHAREIGNKKSLSIIKPMNILQDDDMKLIIARWRKMARKGKRYMDRMVFKDALSRCVYSVVYYLNQLAVANEANAQYIKRVVRGEMKWLDRSDALDPINFQDRRRFLKESLKRKMKETLSLC